MVKRKLPGTGWKVSRKIRRCTKKALSRMSLLPALACEDPSDLEIYIIPSMTGLWNKLLFKGALSNMQSLPHTTLLMLG